MAAPLKNEFWKFRTVHGKDKLFTSPELLWDAACNYFAWCTANPLMSVEYNGKDAKRCLVPKMRAMTMRGLCLYLKVNIGYIAEFKRRLKKTKKDLEFLEVITQIEDTIYTQKFEGAAAGLLSASIIGRELGLVEKQQLDATTNNTTKFTGKLTVTVRSSGVPIANSEADVEKEK